MKVHHKLSAVVLIALTLFVVTPTAAMADVRWPVLRSGSSGIDVRTLQHLLRERNADRSAAGDTGTLRVDGRFGDATRRAVRELQRYKGLTVDGIVGPKTWAALARPVRRGESGEDVYTLQQQLRFNAYALTVDGRFGAATERTVRRAQRDTGLAVDGIARTNLWRELVGRNGD